MIQIIRAGSVALAVLFASSPCLAQTDVEIIRTRVKDGQKVSITDDSGQVFMGKIGVITADGLRIQGDGKSADVRFDRIVRIDRPNDGLANGALIGLGAGAAVGLVAIAAEDQGGDCDSVAFQPYCSDPSAGGYVAVTLLGAALGTAIGVGIDALIRHKGEIYRRADGTHVTAAPSFGHGVRGAVVSVTW
jgi:hypothetical protein